jgi:hypothetical protein
VTSFFYVHLSNIIDIAGSLSFSLFHYPTRCPSMYQTDFRHQRGRTLAHWSLGPREFRILVGCLPLIAHREAFKNNMKERGGVGRSVQLCTAQKSKMAVEDTFICCQLLSLFTNGPRAYCFCSFCTPFLTADACLHIHSTMPAAFQWRWHKTYASSYFKICALLTLGWFLLDDFVCFDIRLCFVSFSFSWELMPSVPPQ